MLSFRSLAEVQAHKPRIPPGVFRCLTSVMLRLLESYEVYDPENDGYVVLITPETTNADALQLIGRPWAKSPFEWVRYEKENRCFVTCILLNNQFALSVIVPDEPWLSRIDGSLRGNLVNQMEGKDAK